MTDRDALLAAILAHPEDDAPRIIFADWLDENAGTVHCPDCKARGAWQSWGGIGCSTCRGTGSVSNGYAERAEFIRVQCELARLDELAKLPRKRTGGYRVPRMEATRRKTLRLKLRRRQQELWPAVHGSFILGPGCVPHVGVHPSPGPFACVVRRGSVASLTIPTAVLLGGECERCWGRGLVDFSDPPPFHANCPQCNRDGKFSGRIPGIVQQLFSNHPVVSVRLSDRHPEDLGYGWGWRFEGIENGPEQLPDELRLAGWTDFVSATADDANQSLSIACVDYGRKLTKLPAISWSRSGKITAGRGADNTVGQPHHDAPCE